MFHVYLLGKGANEECCPELQERLSPRTCTFLCVHLCAGGLHVPICPYSGLSSLRYIAGAYAPVHDLVLVWCWLSGLRKLPAEGSTACLCVRPAECWLQFAVS